MHPQIQDGGQPPSWKKNRKIGTFTKLFGRPPADQSANRVASWTGKSPDTPVAFSRECRACRTCRRGCHTRMLYEETAAVEFKLISMLRLRAENEVYILAHRLLLKCALVKSNVVCSVRRVKSDDDRLAFYRPTWTRRHVCRYSYISGDAALLSGEARAHYATIHFTAPSHVGPMSSPPACLPPGLLYTARVISSFDPTLKLPTFN